jgi:hypothetical protein
MRITPGERNETWQTGKYKHKVPRPLPTRLGNRAYLDKVFRAARRKAGIGAAMSNDAKLGLVLGVAIVMVIALVFFRSDTLAARMPAERSPATTALKKDPTSRSALGAHIGTSR